MEYFAQREDLRFQRADFGLLLRQCLCVLLKRFQHPPQLRLDIFDAVVVL
jgi:hypothetical protein